MTPVQVSLTVSNCLRIERNFLRIMPCDLTLASFPVWCCNALPPWYDLFLCSECLPIALRGLALFLTPENLSLFSLPGISLPTLYCSCYSHSVFGYCLHVIFSGKPFLNPIDWSSVPGLSDPVPHLKLLLMLTTQYLWCLFACLCSIPCCTSCITACSPCSLLYPRTQHMKGPE